MVTFPIFKVTAFLKSNISTEGLSFCRRLIGNHTQSIELYHFQWPWVTSDSDFKVTSFFEVEYRTLLLWHTNKKPHLTYGMVPCYRVWWPWLTSKRVACMGLSSSAELLVFISQPRSPDRGMWSGLLCRYRRLMRSIGRTFSCFSSIFQRLIHSLSLGPTLLCPAPRYGH